MKTPGNIVDVTRPGVKIISKKKRDKGIGFHFCEGLCVTALEQSYKSLNVFYEKKSEKPAHQVLAGVYGIVRHEALNIHTGFDGIQDAIISSKHRYARDVTTVFAKILAQIDINTINPEDVEADPTSILFIESLVDWMTTMHHILLDGNNVYTRRKHMKLFTQKWDV